MFCVNVRVNHRHYYNILVYYFIFNFQRNSNRKSRRQTGTAAKRRLSELPLARQRPGRNTSVEVLSERWRSRAVASVRASARQ